MTKTREQLKAEYESALEQLDTEEQMRAVLTNWGAIQPRMIHQYKLYGSQGSIVFGDGYSGNNDKVTLEQLRDLLRILSPVPSVKAKGTFTRFITESFADSDVNKEKGREDLTSIFPVTLKTNSVCGFSLKAEWFTEIDGRIWSVDAYLLNPYRLAQVNARRVNFKGGHRYEDSRLTIASALTPADGGYWEQVKWGRGSEEYPNDFTAYMTRYDVDPVIWAESVITAFEKEVVTA